MERRGTQAGASSLLQSEVDVRSEVLLLDPVRISPAVYELWLAGLSPARAVEQYRTGDGDEQIRLAYIANMFRVFRLLEPFMQQPAALMQTQMQFQLTAEDEALLIRRYYALVPDVAREFAGRKLGQSIRKELDAIAERLTVPLSVVQRQYNTLHTIYRTVIDMPQRALVDAIVMNFMLPRDMAVEYARVLFTCHHRMELSRRRFAWLDYDGVMTLASLLMNGWTAAGAVDALGIELDATLMKQLRDMKLERSVLERLVSLMVESLTAGVRGLSVSSKTLEQKLTQLMKALLNLASTVAAGNLRDFFVSLSEKMVSKAVEIGLNADGVQIAFDTLITHADTIEFSGTSAKHDSLMQGWLRFIGVVRECVVFAVLNGGVLL